jgi:membrane-bound serine protease (ClpP class)
MRGRVDSWFWHGLAAAVALVLVLVGATRPAAADAGAARVVSIHGVINAVTARYLERELERAAGDGTPLVILRIDTPGGLEPSMREMTKALLGARVPVVSYVAPSGARAASAGMFVALAADVAAMAPGTEIGAAHPVKLGAAESTVDVKVVNDAAAFIRAIAETRHKNGVWAERAVRESASLTAEEARREGVVDLVAQGTQDLLLQLDGRTVKAEGGERTLRTGGLHLDERPMLAGESALQILSDPNVAYLLFLLGLLGIVAEVYHPGSLVPGTLGAVALVLALVSFGNLPISWAGVLLILVAVGLFLAELHTGVGAFAGGALIALVVGSLLLYSPSVSGRAVAVSPWIVAGMSALVAMFFLVVVRATLRARRLAVRTGIAALTGRPGIATSELAPVGTVRVDSEVWSAESDDGPIHEGEPVRVIGAAGVTLRVTRAAPQA